MSLIVRPLQPHEWTLYRELRLAALRDAPDAFGSTLAREEHFPDAEWMERLAAAATSGRDRPLVAEENGVAVGLTWVRLDADDPSIATLYQLWVHPDARRHGLGGQLLASSIAWAREAGATVMTLNVAMGAASAHEFYRRAGFQDDGETSRLRPDSDIVQQSMRRTL